MTSLKSIILRNGESIFNAGFIIALVMMVAAYVAGWQETGNIILLGIFLSPIWYVTLPDWLKHPDDRHREGRRQANGSDG